jgi:hypothetical protein
MASNLLESEEGGLYAQKEALDRVTKALFVKLPPGCERVEHNGLYLAKVSSSTTIPYDMQGRKVILRPSGMTVSEAFDHLREVMFVPHEGSWFMVHATVWADGKSQVRFGYDEEPPSDCIIGGISYLTDQHYFPIDEDKRPDWLKRKLVAGIADLRRYGKKSYPVWLKDMVATGEKPDWL